LNSGLSTDFSIQLLLWLSKKAQRKSESKSEVAQCHVICRMNLCGEEGFRLC